MRFLTIRWSIHFLPVHGIHELRSLVVQLRLAGQGKDIIDDRQILNFQC